MSEDIEKPKSNEEKQSLFSKVLKIVAYPISAAIGVGYWHTHVRNASYNRLRKTGKEEGGVFSDLMKWSKDEQQSLIDSKIVGKDFASKLKVINQQFSKGMSERIEELGYANMWQRYKSLSRYARTETMLTTITAAGIALGVILTAADSKLLNQQMGQDDKSEGAGR